MTRRQIQSSVTGFLGDLGSQLLCLEDVVHSANGRAMQQALAAVAAVRGLEQLAAEAALTPQALIALLEEPQNADVMQLADVISRLLGDQPTRVVAGVSAKTTKDRRVRGKTGRTGDV